jgi:competence protein ComFC
MQAVAQDVHSDRSVPGDASSAAPASSVRPLCRLCRANTFTFARARNWAAYGPSLTAAIMLLKYEEVTRLGDWFAARLAELHSRLSDDDPAAWSAAVVVPVPLHPERRRERGYNQADMIARPFAKRLGLPFRPYLLARIKPRPARLVLSRSEHWESVRNAYATREGLRVDNLRILLVDDVMTTGATLDACSRALRKAGAAEVIALTVARVVPKWTESA